MLSNRQIELLAPARDLATGRVAVDCGADAVYIGGEGFGARRAAGNSVDDVAALVAYARPFGVRVYGALNTLIFEDELDEARRVAQGMIDAGVDALIVQDMALMRMGINGMGAYDKTAAAVAAHASTQTSNIAPEDVAFLGRAGFRRVILERALSIDEIRAIRAACPEEIELEVFVHGAICVGYSGRCFLSRATDPSRSGNRGECSQPCRLAYDLTDGDGRVLVKGKHLLSVRDLDLSARLGELLDAGVSSFKIEGRLKDANYVRNVVSHYRRLLDEALVVRPALRRASVGVAMPDFVPDPAKSFTRGGTEYFFDGARRGVASFDTPKAMGELLGRVEKVGCERTGNRFFTIESGAGRLAAGDGICFMAGGELRGTNINRVEGARIYPDRCEGLVAGAEVWRNYDRAFLRSLEGSRMKRRIAVSASVSMGPSGISVTFTDETGVVVTVMREGSFEPARDPAKMAATVREQLAKSGETIFDLSRVEISRADVSGAQNRSAVGPLPFVPVSQLAAMRREGLEQLREVRAGLTPERRPAVEDMTARYPRTRLTAAENVPNHLSERFWRDHGVEEIESPLELCGAVAGDVVMRSRYCIRREVGACLLEGAEGRQRGALFAAHGSGDLFLVRGNTRWRLGFDCDKCEMVVVKV